MNICEKVMLQTYVISKKLSSNASPDLIIPPFNKSIIRQHLHKYRTSNIVVSQSFDRPQKRLAYLGMNGRAYQSPFTVACAFSHRRVWQHFLSQSQHSQALILEEDALYNSSLQLQYFIKKLTDIDHKWNFLHIGRCWDFCENEKTIYKSNTFRFVKSESPCCSHAYIIKKTAAKQLLKYSLPHFTSVDLFFGFMNRQKLVNMYSVSPPIYTQLRTNTSHDPTALQECDENENTLKSNLTFNDTFIKRILENHWIKHYTYKHDTNLKNPMHPMENCAFVSGKRTSEIGTQILKQFQSLALKGIIIWKLAAHKDFRHTQMILSDTFRWIFEHSNTPFHICWPQKNIHYNLKKNSLVFSAPRESIWSQDKALRTLDFIHTNKYIFYGTPPLKFRNMHNTLQWQIQGETMSIIDSYDFMSDKLITNLAADYALYHKTMNARRINTNKVVISYDIRDQMFCNFVYRCATKIVKYGFYEYKCRKTYQYNSILSRRSRVDNIRNSIFVPILSTNDHIPSDFYTAALFKKLIFTNNPYIKHMYNFSNIIYNDYRICDIPSMFDHLDRKKLQNHVLTNDLYTHRIQKFLSAFLKK
tara:strand:+ start:307 stop:2067 length:1761 start_codon:yes stop_codon:yes gene_type:complete